MYIPPTPSHQHAAWHPYCPFTAPGYSDQPRPVMRSVKFREVTTTIPRERGGRERQTDRDRERHRHRGTDRQTDRQRQRQTDRQTERQTDRQTERERERGGGGGVINSQHKTDVKPPQTAISLSPQHSPSFSALHGRAPSSVHTLATFTLTASLAQHGTACVLFCIYTG